MNSTTDRTAAGVEARAQEILRDEQDRAVIDAWQTEGQPNRVWIEEDIALRAIAKALAQPAGEGGVPNFREAMLDLTYANVPLIDWYQEQFDEVAGLLTAAPVPPAAEPWPLNATYALGDPVQKKGRASWRGKIVGWYRTDLTALGYAVESLFEPGSVQIYPERALEPYTPPAADREPDLDAGLRVLRSITHPDRGAVLDIWRAVGVDREREIRREEAELREALEQGARWFDEYADLHLDKHTEDGNRKAETNRWKARVLRNAALAPSADAASTAGGDHD